MAPMQKQSRALRALTTSALAIPGVAGQAAADAPIEAPDATYRFSFYGESPIDGSKTLSGETVDRYDIQTHTFYFATPVSDRTDFSLDIGYESMAGASPIYVAPGAGGEALQVMSGATIEDARTDVLASGNLYFENGRGGLGAGVSTENDYLAINVGIDGERHLFEKMTTVLAGFGASFDTIDAQDALANPTRPQTEQDKQSYAVFGGISQIIHRAAALQTTLTYQHSTGYLSDPYKQVFVNGSGANSDVRPDSRNQFAWLTRFRRHFESVDGTLHANYRFGFDDWNINSHTAELAYFQTLWRTLRIIPHFRYYTQSQADFYQPFFGQARPDGLQSSDYRLSPFGSLSFGARAALTFDGWWKTTWQAALSYEQYYSGADFALGNVSVENPGLVDFSIIAFNITGRF